MEEKNVLEELKSLHNLSDPTNITEQLGDTKNWQHIAFSFEKQMWNLHQMIKILIDKVENNQG